MAVLGIHGMVLDGACHRSDQPTELALVEGDGHVGLEIERGWLRVNVAMTYDDLRMLRDIADRVLANHEARTLRVGVQAA